MKRLLTFSLLLPALLLTGCGGGGTGKSNKAEITMEDGGKIVVELTPEYAPETVKNFKKLVNDGFYDGLVFHRIVKDFMIQGGDPQGTGSGGSSETITGEFKSNGFDKNTLSHERGVISMARSQSPNSASSQFFICHGDSSFLDGNYAAFGKVIEGMDVVDQIASTEVSADPRSGEVSIPVVKPVIKTIKMID